jgi:hypothetical protein
VENLTMEPTVPQCAGCPHIGRPVPGGKIPDACAAYQVPAIWWRNGHSCPLKPRERVESNTPKKHVDPIKASKRAAKGK